MSFIEGFLTGFGREGTRILQEQDKQKRKMQLLAEQSRMELENSLKINEEKAAQELKRQKEMADYQADLEMRQKEQERALIIQKYRGVVPTQSADVGEPSTAAIADTILDYPLTQTTAVGNETLAPIPQQPSLAPQQEPVTTTLQDATTLTLPQGGYLDFTPEESARAELMELSGIPAKDVVKLIQDARPKELSVEEKYREGLVPQLQELENKQDKLPWDFVAIDALKTNMGDEAAKEQLKNQLKQDQEIMKALGEVEGSEASIALLEEAATAALQVSDSWTNKFLPNVSDAARFLESVNVRDVVLAYINQTKGSISEAENKMFREAGIGPDSTIQQRMSIITIAIADNIRKQQKKEFFEAYRNAPSNTAGTLRGAEAAWRDYVENNKIIEPQKYSKTTGARLTPEQVKNTPESDILSILNFNDELSNIRNDKSYLTYIPGNTPTPKPIPTPTYGTKRPEEEKADIGLSIERLKKSMPNALNILE